MTNQDPRNGRRWLGRVALGCATCWLLAMPAAAQVAADDPSGAVTSSEFQTIDINVQNEDLAAVLQMLSIQSEKNIITSKSVSGTVSANLYDVTFEQALRAILEVNGFVYEERGNFIYVYTIDEWTQIEKARRQRESRIYELNYLSAADAREFITPLLSDEGKLSVRGEVAPGFRVNGDDGDADDYAYNVKVVVNDYEENLVAIEALLRELDIAPRQVLIEATILQTALDEENAFGVDFSVIGSLNFSDLANPLSGVDDLLLGNSTGADVPAGGAEGFEPGDSSGSVFESKIGQTENTIGQTGGFRIGIIQDDISVFLRVLDSVTDSTLLARPKVIALNRQRAQVRVAREEGYVGAENTRENGTTSQEIEFLESGIILGFRPFISENEMTRLELSPELSRSFFTVSFGRQIPNKALNQLTTNVRCRNGETVVLGGLFQEDLSTSRRQVPFLGDVPVFGAAFRSQDDSITRREIIFLITPTIIHDQLLQETGQLALDSVDHAMIGARAGLLPFSREKQTLAYNRKAYDAFNEGDADEALYYINASLHLNNAQPEMLRLKERVTGQQMHRHERSLYERLLRRELTLIDGDPDRRERATDADEQ